MEHEDIGHLIQTKDQRDQSRNAKTIRNPYP
jgi:hypothetical protein